MADAKRMTLMNQSARKVTLAADPEELKANPKAKHREILGGRSLEVSAEEGAKLVGRYGLVDLSKIVASEDSSQVKALKAQLAAAQAENEKLKAAGKDEKKK